MEKLCVKVDEAAKMLSIGRTAMYELLAGKQIRSIKIGSSRVVEVDSIKAYIANRATDDDLIVIKREVLQ